MTILTNPIIIPIRPRLQFAITDWTNYRQRLNDFKPQQLQDKTLEDIDHHIDNWTNKIRHATNTTTPTNSHRVITWIKPNQYLRRLNRTHSRLMTIIDTYEPNPI